MKRYIYPAVGAVGNTLRGTAIHPVAKFLFIQISRILYFSRGTVSRSYQRQGIAYRLHHPSSVNLPSSTISDNVDEDTVSNRKNLDRTFWANGWHDAGQVVHFDPGFAQPQLMRPAPRKPYYLFYEYRDSKARWNIGVATADNMSGPFDTHTFPILAPTGNSTDPDDQHIADPSVLYLEDRDPSWHMWFDTCDTKNTWRLGHATSSDGINWDRDTSNGRTEVVLDLGSPGEWDDKLLHAPEAFIYDDEIRVLYNAQGSGHTGFDGGLATVVESDEGELSLEREGQVTDDTTCSGWIQNRIQKPIQIDGTLYTIVGWDGNSDAAIIRSSNGGHSWEEVVEFPYPMVCSLFVDDSVIYGIGSDRHLVWKRIPS